MKNLVFALLLSVFAINATAQRLLGGDISLLPSYESGGTQYRDSTGKAMPFFQLVKDQGKWNAIRVRLFVNPADAPQSAKDEGVCQDINYIIPLCKQIKAEEMRLMLDFHYSDTWADPAKQFIPKSWTKAGKAALPDSVYAFTRRSLLRLKAEGVSPDLIQVGNEITFGMLWPYGKVDPLFNVDGNHSSKADKSAAANWDFLAECLKSGSRACREICPDAKIIIHTEHAQDWKTTYGYYDKLRHYGIDYDVIGLSYYPMWHGTIAHLNVVLDSLEARFQSKQIMIVETAGYYSHENDPWATSSEQYSDLFPITPQGQAEYTLELVSMLNHHPRVTGLFWWFPEENQSGSPQIKNWINRGLFDNHTGRALPAFYELAKFRKSRRYRQFRDFPDQQFGRAIPLSGL